MALIPPFFLDCVVALGIAAPQAPTQWIASGFLFGDPAQQEQQEPSSQRPYYVFLVTNRHVLDGKRQLAIRLNPEAMQPAREFTVTLVDDAGNQLWTGHPDKTVDIGVIQIHAPRLREEKIKFSYFQGDEHVLNLEKARNLGVTEGDGVFALGFPLGIVGPERNFVIVRQGTIARIRDALAGASNEFIIDATSFPGNSGGPVVTKPESTSIRGTQSVASANLIGIVKGYVYYEDTAISRQTKQPRVIFQENTGLTEVIPVDFVEQTIVEARKGIRK